MIYLFLIKVVIIINFAVVFKAESLNADMSLSISEKPVPAEKEDDKNGNHYFTYIHDIGCKFILTKVFVLPGNTEEGPSVDLLGASPKANPGCCF